MLDAVLAGALSAISYVRLYVGRLARSAGASPNALGYGLPREFLDINSNSR